MKITQLITNIDRDLVFEVGDTIYGGSYISTSKIKYITDKYADGTGIYYSVILENDDEIVVPFSSAIVKWSKEDWKIGKKKK